MFGFLFSEKERDAMTQPKTDLAYLRNEKAKAEQKLRSCQHREKILERQMSELNRREVCIVFAPVLECWKAFWSVREN